MMAARAFARGGHFVVTPSLNMTRPVFGMIFAGMDLQNVCLAIGIPNLLVAQPPTSHKNKLIRKSHKIQTPKKEISLQYD